MSIRVDRRDAVTVLTLDRPAALNALSLAMLDELEASLLRVDGDPGQRAIVLTGAGEKAEKRPPRFEGHAELAAR